MKARLIVIVLLLGAGMIRAQEERIAGMPSDNVVRNYLTEVQGYAALYSGKMETPYEKRSVEHPYFETDMFVSGTLCYNHVVYKDVLMRFDLFRNEMAVTAPNRGIFPNVLTNEKFEYAILNGSTIVLSVSEADSRDKFMVILQNGVYPVVRKYKMGRTNLSSFMEAYKSKNQYEIYINDVPYPVKNKNSILKLFPDKRKELNEYAKQHKLNFRNQLEQSILALVNHYEDLTHTNLSQP